MMLDVGVSSECLCGRLEMFVLTTVCKVAFENCCRFQRSLEG